MSLAATWLSGDAWRRPDSDIDGLFSSGFYLDIAKRAEAARLDFVFRPDTLNLDVRALEKGPGFSSLDPTILLAALARETTHIGLLSTVSTTFTPPYVVARQLQSLNWLSNGRAGWNIVTALDGNENFGLASMPSGPERYQRAAEFVEVVRRLWQSYPGEALRFDREQGRFAETAQVRAIDHAGLHFSVRGPLNLPSRSGSDIPLVQAGASSEGRNFAASIADAVFASTPDIKAALEIRRDLRQRAERHGRKADDILVLPGLSLYLATTRAEAVEIFRATHARTEKSRKLASIKAMLGLDLAAWPKDRVIGPDDLPSPPANVRSRTHADLLRRMIVRDAPTVEQLLDRPEVIGSAHWQIIGTADDAAAQIKNWAAAGAIDGFIAVPGGSVGSMRLTLSEVVPNLAEAGLFRREYSGATFADHLRRC